MTSIARGALALAMAGTLTLGLGACGNSAAQQDESTTQVASDQTEQTSTQAPAKDSAPGEGAGEQRIDVRDTGTQVATYAGPKYIASDATVDQGQGDAVSELGLQEICVVSQPESWQDVASIGWNRNSIDFTGVTMPWGTASYRYEYVNEAGLNTEGLEWSRTTEQSYFDGAGNVSHTTVGDHEVAYVQSDPLSAPSVEIPDLEAGESGTPDPQGSTFTVYAYEQRANKCALTVAITCEAAPGASLDLTAEQAIADAYAPLSFVAQGEATDAAPYTADLTLLSEDGTKSLVVRQASDELLSYAKSQATLLAGGDPSVTVCTTTYDLASQQSAPEGAEVHEVDGLTVHTVESPSEWSEGARTLQAWTTVEDCPLYVEAQMGEAEDADATLARVLGERVAVGHVPQAPTAS